MTITIELKKERLLKYYYNIAYVSYNAESGVIVLFPRNLDELRPVIKIKDVKKMEANEKVK